MNIINKLAIKSLRYRKLTIMLSILSIALGVLLLLGVERIRYQIKDSFSSSISNTDLVVGARNGEVSLLLSSIFHIGHTSQNIAYSTFQSVSENPVVEWAIPLSLGDSYKGFTVLGTSDAYFEHYKYGKGYALEASKGHLDIHNTQAVIGAKVVRELNLNLGDTLYITHGSGKENFISHNDEPFIVAGFLKPTGTPLDGVVHISLHAMDEIHQDFYGDDHSAHDPLGISEESMLAIIEDSHSNHEKEGNSPDKLTAFMLGLKDPHEVLSFMRMLNEYKKEPITAIMPAVTLIELWRLVRPMEMALLIISMLVLMVTFAGILTTLMTSLQERHREMAVLRSVGANASQVFRLILAESIGVTGLGIVLGCGLLFALFFVLKPFLATQFGLLFTIEMFRPSEILLLTIIWIGGAITGFWPAYRSYKTSLAEGLIIRV